MDLDAFGIYFFFLFFCNRIAVITPKVIIVNCVQMVSMVMQHAEHQRTVKTLAELVQFKRVR